MSRHSKLKELSPQQVNRIMRDATSLYHSINEPSLKIGCEHHNALRDLAEALVTFSKAITGQDHPPWALRGSGHTGFYEQRRVLERFHFNQGHIRQL